MCPHRSGSESSHFVSRWNTPPFQDMAANTRELAAPAPFMRGQRFSRAIGSTAGGSEIDGTEALTGAFFWLSAFYLVYCARPQEIIPGLNHLPVAKITSAFAVLSLIFSLGRAPRRLSDLPREAFYLLALIGLLFVSAVFSPVWKGGAFFAALDFSKVFVMWLLAFLLITTFAQLQRIILIQAASVAAVATVAAIKGHSVARLDSVIGGIYSNPNDLAFAIVLSIPFCLAFFLTAKNLFIKLVWSAAMVVMLLTLLLTASRGGFIDVVVTGTVCLWHFGVEERKTHIIVGSAILAVALLLAAGDKLKERFISMSSTAEAQSEAEESAEESYEERKALVGRSLEAIASYPLLGVGAENFVVYSGMWREVHVAYLQIAADGGILALILYLLFFRRGFVNLRYLRESERDFEVRIFTGAIHASLIGFVIGAAFAPQAYVYFPYLTVCYTSVLAATVRRDESSGTQSDVVFRPFARRWPRGSKPGTVTAG
jgi:hypothetical protein